jgi:hypothetical protein
MHLMLCALYFGPQAGDWMNTSLMELMLRGLIVYILGSAVHWHSVQEITEATGAQSLLTWCSGQEQS